MSELVNFIKRDIKYFYYSKIKHMSEQQIKQEYLRKIGMNIGEECFIFSDKIETAEPYLVSLGNHVTIAMMLCLQLTMHQLIFILKE